MPQNGDLVVSNIRARTERDLRRRNFASDLLFDDSRDGHQVLAIGVSKATFQAVNGTSLSKTEVACCNSICPS